MKASDLMGLAIANYFEGKDTEDLWNETTISEKDRLPMAHLFRDFKHMPAIEQHALKTCTGTVLDLGCGAGSHSLYLQKRSFDVVALDSSQASIQVCEARGVHATVCEDFMNYDSGRFDTILMLLNGTGLFERVDLVGKCLAHLKKLLLPKGQILIDSSDLTYMYDKNADGSIAVPNNLDYYGQLECRLSYKNLTSEPYYWLYLDPSSFETLAQAAGFDFEITYQGNHFDYLARLTAV